MALSKELFPVTMTQYCPYCDHPLCRKGSWFASLSYYRCVQCRRDVTMTYEMKVKLFAGYARVQPELESGQSTCWAMPTSSSTHPVDPAASSKPRPLPRTQGRLPVWRGSTEPC